MQYRRTAIALAIGSLLAGCGSSGPAATSPNPQPYVPQPQSASSTQSIAASGGTVTTSLNGQAVNVAFPAGAFAAATNVTLTVYTSSSSPKVVQSQQRGTQSLPADAFPTLAFVVDAGTATLLKPGKVSAQMLPPASGAAYRLAGYGTIGFADVDTVTFANGTGTEDNNSKYAQLTRVNAQLYAFYTTSKPAAAPTFGVAVSGSATVPALTSATYTAADVDPNGFPILPSPTFAFSVDTPLIGSIDSASGTLSTGPTDASGNVVATDASRSLTGKGAVKVSSAVRPAGAADTFTFKGTLTTTLTGNKLPGSTGPVSSTEQSAVTQNLTAKGSTDGVNYEIDAAEADAAALRTYSLNSKTFLAFQKSGNSFVVRTTKSVATDSNAASFETDYGPNNGAVTVIPEVATTLNNDAAATYLENDPGNPGFDKTGHVIPTIVRTTAANGSYTMSVGTSGLMNYYVGNADGTGSAQLNFNGGLIEYDFLPPVAGPPAYVPIPIYFLNLNYQKTGFAGTSQVFPWYGTTVPTLSADAVTVAPGSTLDASCAAFGGAKTATLVTEQYKAFDLVLGQIETRTIKSYDVAGPGTICVVLNDSIVTYYDYSGQEGATIKRNPTDATPFAQTTVTETLSLSGTSASSVGRSTQSVGGLHLPLASALRVNFDRVAAQERAAQARRLTTSIRSLRGTH